MDTLRSKLALTAFAAAMSANAAEPVIPAETRAAFSAITAHAQVKKGLEFLKADDANTLVDQKALVVIPAPPLRC